MEEAISSLIELSKKENISLPVLAYYGAGRAWLPSNKKREETISRDKPKQFDAYRGCLSTKIEDKHLNEWFLFETAAISNRNSDRPGFHAVKSAVLGCIPDADDLYYDSDLKQIVLSISGFPQPYYNLSAGQQMMLALIADIAIKAVTLNSYLFGPDQPASNDPSKIFAETSGIVLIDELDVHLHPRWQRSVVSDLKRTFPRIQFVCTSHSPQIIGEVFPEEIRVLEEDGLVIPKTSFGIDRVGC